MSSLKTNKQLYSLGSCAIIPLRRSKLKFYQKRCFNFSLLNHLSVVFVAAVSTGFLNWSPESLKLSRKRSRCVCVGVAVNQFIVAILSCFNMCWFLFVVQPKFKKKKTLSGCSLKYCSLEREFSIKKHLRSQPVFYLKFKSNYMLLHPFSF